MQVADEDETEKPQAREEEEKPVVKAEIRSEPKTLVAPIRANPEQLQLAAVLPDVPAPVSRPRPAYITAAPLPPRAAEPDHTATAAIAHVANNDGSTTHPKFESGSAVTPSAMRWQSGPGGKIAARIAAAPETPAKPQMKSQEKSEEKSDSGVSSHAKQVATTKPAVSGWTIQIGATDDEPKAEALIARAKAQRAALLSSARPYTEAVHKGKETIYRARFAGLEESRAAAACKALKTSGFNCFATRN
jgi:D-alanyl-D-alanine carboxypeptidase